MSPNSTELFHLYVDATAEVVETEENISRITQDYESVRDHLRNEVKRTLGSDHPEYGRSCFDAWRESSELSEIGKNRARLEQTLEALQSEQQKAAILFSNALPPIQKADLKEGHIYRGGLLRNLILRREAQMSEEGFYIENLAFGLNPGTFENMLDFTGVIHPQVALHFALKGWVDDDRNREDAVVIEAPYDLVRSLERVPDGSSKYSLLPDLFRKVRLKLFKPFEVTS